MSAYAKSVVAAVAAVLIAGITAWQSVAADGFRPVDVLPVAIAVASAALTFLVPNVPQLPWAKSAVSTALAVLTAVATFVTGHPAEVDVANVVVAGLGALLVWYVPNLGPAPAPVGEDGVPSVTDLPAQDDPAPAEYPDDRDGTQGPDGLDDEPGQHAAPEPGRTGSTAAHIAWAIGGPVTGPLTAPIAAVGAWTPPTLAATAAEPTPIEAEAAAAAERMAASRT